MSRSKYIALLIIIGVVLFSVARLAVFMMYGDLFSAYGITDILLSFLRGIRFDLSIFLTLLAPFWLLLLIPINIKIIQKIILWLMFPIYLFMTVFLAVDIVYFGNVSRHMANEPFLIGNDIGFMFDMIPLYIVPCIIGLVLIIGAGFLWNKIASINILPDKSWKKPTVRFIIWAALIFLAIRGTVTDKPISTIDAFVSGDTNLGNLTLNGLFSSARYYKNQNTASDKDYTFYNDDDAYAIFESRRGTVCDKPELPAKPNIVFILLEGWSAYYVDSFSGNGFNLTPEFDNLTKTGIKFINHYSPDKRSISSIQSALTGIPPITGLPSLGFGLETLAKGNVGKMLASKGYDTIFLQSSRRRSFYMDSIAKSLGFKDYYGMEDAEVILDYPDKSASKFGWDYETYMLLKDKLHNKTDKPFFAFLFTGTTHTPFAKLPAQFMRYPHDTENEDGFMNTLLYADWSLGEFFRQVKDEPWFNNTVFIISADHNIGKYEKVTYPEDYRIPLLIWSQNMDNASVIETVTSHIDLSPTLLDIADIKDDSYLGQSIFCKDDKGYAVTTEWNAIGLVKKGGYLKHSFRDILNFAPADMPQSEKELLEKILLSYYQVGFDKVFNNKTEQK